jgi:uncharacterized integral membrane protein
MQNITPGQIINIILIVILLVFVGQNLEAARLKFLFFAFEMPLIILIATVFFIGYFTAKVLGNWGRVDK